MFISSSSAGQAPTTFSGRVMRFVGRFIFWWLAALLVACLVAVALVVLVLSLLRSWITGRKASPSMVFGNFKRYAPDGMWPGARRGATPSAQAPGTTHPAHPNKPLGRRTPGSAAGGVVDVEAREIPDTKH